MWELKHNGRSSRTGTRHNLTSEAAVVPATAAPSHDAAVWPVPRLRWLPAHTVWAALVCIPVRDAAGPRSWPRHGEQRHKYCWGESGNVCQWARKIRMGKGPPGAPRKGWTSAEGLWALGARCACVTLPQCAPPANTFPTTAAATSQPVRLPKIACRRVGSSHTRALAASVAGTSLVVALTSISVPLSATSLVLSVCKEQGLGPKLWCWCQCGHWGCTVTDLPRHQAPARLPLVVFSFPAKLTSTAAGDKSEVLSAIEV